MFGVQVTPTAEQLVTQPAPNSVPYILFYRSVAQELTTSVFMWHHCTLVHRRGDTMVGVEKTVK